MSAAPLRGARGEGNRGGVGEWVSRRPFCLSDGPRSRVVADVATCSYIGAMHAVGIRELKNKLSHYVKLVEAGETVLVTDRGTVVAEMGPPGARAREDRSVPAGLLEMVRRGEAVLGGPNDPSLYPRRERVLPEGVSILDLLEEDRRDEPVANEA